MKNLNFKTLVAKMDALKETEQGKLKGGISTLNSSKSGTPIGSYNGFACGIASTMNKSCPSTTGSKKISR